MEIIGLLFFVMLLVAIPLFFFFRWLFGAHWRHHFESEVTRMVGTWIATIVSIPIVCIAVAILFVKASEYYPDRRFTKEAWMGNADKRYELTKKLISSKMLIGKTREEVVQILGQNTADSDTSTMYYSIGFIPLFMDTHNLSPALLYVKFQNNRVIAVSQSHDE